jgi:NitT/TauT family transport system substrate-binding protein
MAGIGLAGCNRTEKAVQPAKTISIGIMPDAESIPLIIADKNGYFSKQGVNVKLVPFKAAKDLDSALQSGQLDGMITDIVAVLFANDGGINIRMAAKTDGTIKLMAGRNTGINSVGELKGKRVGFSSNTIMEYTLDRMLEAGKLSAADVNKIAIPQLPTRLEMLQGGKIDAAILNEPLAGLAIKSGAQVLTTTDQLGNRAGVIAFTTKVLEENPAEIKAIFRAYNDAVEYIQKEPPANYIDFVIQTQGFPAEVKDIIQLPQYTKAELPSEQTFNDVLRWMQSKNLLRNQYEYRTLINENVLR